MNLHYSIIINAPREHVWNVMLEDATYREWTVAFDPGSHYKGNWEQGSRMQFIGTGENGQELGGMMAEIAENRLHEFVSIRHIGEIHDGEEKPWAEDGQAYENYTFRDVSEGTELVIDLTGIPDEYVDMFEDMWPKALEKLKEMAEK